MRICHISTVHPAADARIFYRMASALARRGHVVSLIGRTTFDTDSGVRPSPWNDRIGGAGRGGRIALALRAALSEQADIYHFHDPELIALGIALKTVRPSCAVVYDVHEDYPSMMLEKYWLPRAIRPLMSKSAAAANRLAAFCFDGIVTADPWVAADFQNVAEKKTIVYYNFPVPSLFAANGKKISATADLVYVGGMSERSGIFVLLDALALLARQNIRPSVKLAGYTDGDAGRVAIERGITSRGLQEQIDFVGRIPHSDVPSLIRSGRVGLVMLQPIPKFMKNIPSKMFEYWACGLPVIASDLPPIRRFVSDGEQGLLFSPDSPSSLAQATQVMMQHPEDRQRMGQVGEKQFLTRWNNETQVEQLIRFYEQIVTGKATIA
jgi:glycosyltransferase involved in cell wall biosynthesis